MRINELISESIWSNKNKAYKLMIDRIDSGPFDGGCVVVAQALQQALNTGEIVVLTNEDDQAEHAALQIGNTLIDGDGAASADKFIARFNQNELPHKPATQIRKIHTDDLPGASRDQELSQALAKLIKTK